MGAPKRVHLRHIGRHFQTHSTRRFRPQPRLELFDHDSYSETAVTSWDNQFVVNRQNWETVAQALLDASENDVGIGPHEPNTKIACAFR